MEPNDLVPKRKVESLLAVVMDYYNGMHFDDDNEALEILRREASKAHRGLALSGYLRLSINVLGIDDVEGMFPTVEFSSKQKSWVKKRVDVPNSSKSSVPGNWGYPGSSISPIRILHS